MIFDEKKKKRRETKTYNERYNEDTQRLILSMLLSDTETFSITRNLLIEEYFDDVLQPGVEFILSYSDKYRNLPSIEQIKALSGVKLEKFSEAGNHSESLRDIVVEFAKYKAMEIAVLDSVELLQSGRADEIVERGKQALSIGLISDLGTSYFNDPKGRLDAILDKSGYVSTGWNTLDSKLYGGFQRGDLNVFAGLSGSGKSLFLQNLAINWSLMGYNVLYISLELSENLIALRFDAMVTGMSTKEVLGDVDKTVFRVMHTHKHKNAGDIYIKKLPEGGTTVNTLRSYIKEFQIRNGFMPDAILIDYLDLMYPINQRIDPSDLFIKDKYVSEEIRAFMQEVKVFGATASQLNRGGVEATEYDHSHIAGGISKINTSDNVFAIFASMAMKEKGMIKLQFLKTRSSSATGQIIELGYNTDTMRITDYIAEEVVDRPQSKADLQRETYQKQVPMKVAAPVVEEEPVEESGLDIINRIKSKLSRSV